MTIERSDRGEGAPGPVPVRRQGRIGPWILVGFLVVAGLLLSAIALAPWYFNQPQAIPHGTPTTVVDLGSGPFVSAEPVTTPAAHRGGPAQGLVGAVFAAGEATREMHLTGLPFRFLTPQHWGCLAGTASKGNVTVQADTWRCIDEQAGDSRPQIDIVVRHCAAACTEAQRTELDGVLSHPPTYRVRDAATRYAEQTVGGRYVIAVNRVFAAPGGGPADWQVLLEAEAQPADAAVVQKIVNDIWAQTL